jgi:hypothetical protein
MVASIQLCVLFAPQTYPVAKISLATNPLVMQRLLMIFDKYNTPTKNELARSNRPRDRTFKVATFIESKTVFIHVRTKSHQEPTRGRRGGRRGGGGRGEARSTPATSC